MELLETVESCLAAAERVGDQLAASLANRVEGEAAVVARMRWIERQLASLTSRLAAAREDLGAGVSAAEMGYENEQELQDLLEDIAVQIGQLSVLLHALVMARTVCR